jgi:hypothetical protein
MARSLITRHFDSPYLLTDAESGREHFLFPESTDRDEIIMTLERYAEFRQFCRVHKYQLIGGVLNDNIFIKKQGIDRSLEVIGVLI